ncbi:hypothetical protein HIM_04415 [Hirsutella minnesotensis 3608]|uniref:Uncharacterized protein n=1 Tax=Hirsutella minnesotensis 3608 TaxID=1043627 RepID=A0A0F7ZVB7_9HYPO|nr:hypothetical protein HIM_04415 [Hirsutella minnesotensis 3608]
MDAASLFDVKGKVVLVTGGKSHPSPPTTTALSASPETATPCIPKASGSNVIPAPGAKGIGRMIAHGFVASGATLCLPLLERAAAASTSTSASASGSDSGSDADSAAACLDPARVIHIGSIDGLRVPAVANFAYSASKAGLHHLSRALARELGPRRVTSNVVACGPFPTKMMRATLDSFGDVIRDEVPLHRVGSPEDVAGACLYLASRAGAYCNGALIRVDGGASLASKI